MKNPFPGMNPYLEMHWSDVHTSLVTYIRNQLQRRLSPGLVARAEERGAIDDTGSPLTYWPGVQVKEAQRRGATESSAAVVQDGGGTEVMEPLLVVTGAETERWMEIRDLDGRLVTAIEGLSPANKSSHGLEAHRGKRARFLAGGANMVELDRLREGRNPFDLPPHAFPTTVSAGYRACVRRAKRSGEAEIYFFPLRRRLPGIRIPLRATDADVVRDLQPLVDQCFEDGGYSSLDYRPDPEPPFALADAQWIDECLRKAGLC